MRVSDNMVLMIKLIPDHMMHTPQTIQGLHHILTSCHVCCYVYY